MKLLVLQAGGPAPGIPNVQEAAALQAMELGWSVYGLPGGFRDLADVRSDPRLVALTRELVEGAGKEGRILLSSSRTSLVKDPEAASNAVKKLEELGISQVLTIGGDDTLTSSAALCAASAGKIKVVHAPKTIDDDLPLPEGVRTFGVDSAAEYAAHWRLRGLAREAQVNPNHWFLAVIMGRRSGSLALRAAEKAKTEGYCPAITVIPELFDIEIEFQDLVDLITGAVLLARSRGTKGGVILVSEGCFESCSPQSIEKLVAGITHDDHGHVEISQLQFPGLLARLIKQKFSALEIPFAIRTEDIAHGLLRTCEPSNFDFAYTSAVGKAAVDCLAAGRSNLTVYYCGAGQVGYMPFADAIDPATNRARTRAAKPHELYALYDRDPFLNKNDLVRGLDSMKSMTQREFEVRFAHVAYLLDR